MKLNEEKIVKYLKENVGKSISTKRMIKEADACEGKFNEINLMDAHYEIQRIAEANGFRMDFNQWKDMLVGLPYALDGVIKRKRVYKRKA